MTQLIEERERERGERFSILSSVGIINTKMESLTYLERIGPKGWLRYVFPFQLADDYDIGEVSTVLRAGFEAAKQRFPVMASEAVPDTEAKRKSRRQSREAASSTNMLPLLSFQRGKEIGDQNVC